QKYGTDEIARDEFTQDRVVFDYQNLALHNEPNSLEGLTTTDYRSSRIQRDPVSDAQDLQHLSRGEVAEHEPSYFFFVGRQLDRPALRNQTECLDEVDSGKDSTP